MFKSFVSLLSGHASYISAWRVIEEAPISLSTLVCHEGESYAAKSYKA